MGVVGLVAGTLLHTIEQAAQGSMGSDATALLNALLVAAALLNYPDPREQLTRCVVCEYTAAQPV